jgi:hypothetical protein
MVFSILSLGPTFSVTASANAKLGIGIDTAIGLIYSVNNASLVFPPSQGPSGGDFVPLQTRMQFILEDTY